MSGIEFMSCTAEARVHSPDENFEYHFSIVGRGGEHYVGETGEDTTTTGYMLMIDSTLPFYIKRFDIPVYYTVDGSRVDTTLTCYAVRPYVSRTGGLPLGSANYRLRAIVDGHYRSTYEGDSYGNSRDCTIKFDGEIICPCSSSVKSKWANSDGSYLTFAGWDQEDPELEISDDYSYLDIWWYDGTVLQQYLNASPYDVYRKVQAYYYPIDLIIGEQIGGEAPRVDGAFGNVEFGPNTNRHYSSAGINFGNNPVFTGTYNEYRTYCENLVRNGS